MSGSDPSADEALAIRRFNITGPCVPGRDHMVDLAPRLHRPLQAIRRGESLLLTHTRQSGKTTLLRQLAHGLRQEGLCVCLCALQLAEDQTLTGLYRLIEATLRQSYPVPALPKWTPTEPQSHSFCTWLGEAGQKLGRPLVLILDEYDAPPRKLVMAMLRSFRAALTLADEGRPFVHALVLAGKTHVRDLRDELRPTGDESRGTGSLWNVAVPLPLGPFSRAEVESLLDQHTEDTGIVWERQARDEVYHRTHGQPWLVNRLGYLLDEQLQPPASPSQSPSPQPVTASPSQSPSPTTTAASPPYAPSPATTPSLAPSPQPVTASPSPAPSPRPVTASPPPAPQLITAALVRAAANQLLEEDQVHLLDLGDLLLGRRDAQDLLLRLLGGEDIALSRTSEAQSFLLDAGLIIPSESRRSVEILCPIYAAYLGRWLTEQP